MTLGGKQETEKRNKSHGMTCTRGGKQTTNKRGKILVTEGGKPSRKQVQGIWKKKKSGGELKSKTNTPITTLSLNIFIGASKLSFGSLNHEVIGIFCIT